MLWLMHPKLGTLLLLLLCLLELRGSAKELQTSRWPFTGTDDQVRLLPDDSIA